MLNRSTELATDDVHRTDVFRAPVHLAGGDFDFDADLQHARRGLNAHVIGATVDVAQPAADT